MFSALVVLVAVTVPVGATAAHPPKSSSGKTHASVAPKAAPKAAPKTQTQTQPKAQPSSRFAAPASGFQAGTTTGTSLRTTTLGRGLGASSTRFSRSGFGYGYGAQFGLNQQVPAVLGPPQFAPGLVLANEFPATLTIQFPTTSQMWLNGEQMGGEMPEEHVLTSPDLHPGEQYTFEVKLRWMVGDKTYESNRRVTLGSGERGRLLIVSGTEVK